MKSLNVSGHGDGDGLDVLNQRERFSGWAPASAISAGAHFWGVRLRQWMFRPYVQGQK